MPCNQTIQTGKKDEKFYFGDDKHSGISKEENLYEDRFS